VGKEGTPTFKQRVEEGTSDRKWLKERGKRVFTMVQTVMDSEKGTSKGKGEVDM